MRNYLAGKALWGVFWQSDGSDGSDGSGASGVAAALGQATGDTSATTSTTTDGITAIGSPQGVATPGNPMGLGFAVSPSGDGGGGATTRGGVGGGGGGQGGGPAIGPHAGNVAPGIRGTVNALMGQLQAGQQGPQAFSNIATPPGLLSGVATATSPVAVSNLGPPSAVSPTLSQLAQLFSLLSPTLGGSTPGGTANMGFPAAALAHTPGGGYGSSGSAPPGSQIGQATVSPGTTAPTAVAQADEAQAAQTATTLGLDAQAVADNTAPVGDTSTDTTQAPPAQDTSTLGMGQLLADILGLSTGSQTTLPALAALAMMG